MMSIPRSLILGGLQPRRVLIFLTTGLIRSGARCALGREASSGGLDTMLACPRYGEARLLAMKKVGPLPATAPAAVRDL